LSKRTVFGIAGIICWGFTMWDKPETSVTEILELLQMSRTDQLCPELCINLQEHLPEHPKAGQVLDDDPDLPEAIASELLYRK
jgi:hypothetical protein